MKINKQAGVWAIIYCPSAGTFLFGRRSETVNKPGVWNFFGGHVDPGETAREALLRELSEEAGIERKGDDLVHFGAIRDDDIQGLGYVEALRELHYYLLLADSEFVPRLNHEHSEFRWVKPHNLPRNLNRPSAIAINIGLIQKALQLAD